MPAVPINDTHIYYIDIGSGIPTLVMHGGLGQDHTFMHPWLDPLGDVLRLFYYDHRGQGKSGRPDPETLTFESFTADANTLRAHLGYEQMAVIGSSFGSFIALEYALRFPHRVSHLILMSTAGRVDYGQEIVTNLYHKTNDPEVLQEFLSPNTEDDLAYEWHNRIIAPLYFHNYDERLAEEMMKDTVFSASAYERNDVLMPQYNVFPRLGGLKAPTLILVGDDDFITPLSQAQRLHQAIAGSELVVIPQSGHFCHVESSQMVCTVIREWLKYVDQKRQAHGVQ